MPDPVKYDKTLSGDEQRNSFLVDELVKMRRAGRKILVFSRLKDHLKTLKSMFEQRWNVLDIMVSAVTDDSQEEEPDVDTRITLLVGGLKPAQMEAAMSGDVIFTTYAFGRDAMNVPHIDTVLFATPPGNPLQPIGRLRDKGPADRRPLLGVDPYEDVPYSIRKAGRREQTYQELGIRVTRVSRTPK